MSEQGTVANNTFQGNPRSIAIRAVAKANKLDLEIVHTEPAKGVPEEYLKINPLGRIPSFVGADGYTLSECIAIAIYSKFPSGLG
jgi:elongation factor 1-gamma